MKRALRGGSRASPKKFSFTSPETLRGERGGTAVVNFETRLLKEKKRKKKKKKTNKKKKKKTKKKKKKMKKKKKKKETK